LQIARECTTVLSGFSGPVAPRRRKTASKYKNPNDFSTNDPIRENDMPANFDAIDRKIMRELVRDARVSQAVLSERIGLSPTACGRRLQRLEEAGVIRGYSAEIDAGSLGYRMHVIVNITLDRQSENALAAFEKAISKCPDVVSCYLMSGSDDYLVQVQARDMEDYERIHSQHLSRLPGVARLQSSFAMRNVIKRGISAAALAG
jgi:Lrp/AsnC family leucine-responsive transcriptional regulator